MARFTYVTGNESKIEQMREVSPIPFETTKIEIDEIQSTDPRVVAEHKARAAYQQLQKTVLVEDSSLEFKALRGLPGPFVKWFIEGIGPQGLADMLGDDRQAIARNTYALFDGEQVHFFEAFAEGEIVRQARGSHGFGFDSIFQPNGHNQTIAEMDRDVFKSISLRRKALKQFVAFIESEGNKYGIF